VLNFMPSKVKFHTIKTCSTQNANSTPSEKHLMMSKMPSKSETMILRHSLTLPRSCRRIVSQMLCIIQRVEELEKEVLVLLLNDLAAQQINCLTSQNVFLQ